MRIDDHEAAELLEALNSPLSCDMADECTLPAQLGNLLLDRAEYIEALKAAKVALDRIEYHTQDDTDWCTICWEKRGDGHLPGCIVNDTLALLRNVLEAT